jgi:hypothetical protein
MSQLVVSATIGLTRVARHLLGQQLADHASLARAERSASSCCRRPARVIMRTARSAHQVSSTMPAGGISTIRRR